MLSPAICRQNMAKLRTHRLTLEHSPCSFRNGQCSDRDSHALDNWQWKWILRLHQARLQSTSAYSHRYLSRLTGRRLWRTTPRLRFAHQLRASRRRRSYCCRGQWSFEVGLLRPRLLFGCFPELLSPLTELLMNPLAKLNYLSPGQSTQWCFGLAIGYIE